MSAYSKMESWFRVDASPSVPGQCGLLARTSIPAGTSLPYTVITKPTSDGLYQMQAEYMNARGQQLSFLDWKFCGDPAALQYLAPLSLSKS